MNLEQRLEIARVRAEKEQPTHSVETELELVKQERDFWKNLVSNTVNADIEKHLKSASWNLNRIATVLEKGDKQ